MAIARPTSKTIISTTGWGIPITDAVNANTDALVGMKPGAWTNLTTLNGWTSSAPVAGFQIVNGFLILRGNLSGSQMGVAVANLPVNARPSATATVIVWAWTNVGNFFVLLSIKNDGNLQFDTAYGTTGASAVNIGYILPLF